MTVVLLALDETAASGAAAAAARRLFGESATYLAVNVAEVPPWWAPPTLVWGGVVPFAQDPTISAQVISRQLGEADESARQTAADLVGEAGISAVALGASGDPVEAIIRAAEEHAADVIVLGSSEKSWWRRVTEGSVAKEVTRASTLPVLIVPHDDLDA